MEKKEIRKQIKEKKAALNRAFISDYSELLCYNFTQQDFYKEAEVLYSYLAYNEEIITDALIRSAWADGKKVAVPRVISDGVMEFFYIDSFDDIELGFVEIPEPPYNPERIARDKKVLILMPGLAFGRDRNRIGYGGGFYDRYLEAREAEGTEFLKVALAYNFQIFDTVPAEEHDYKVDILLSSREIIR